jgi:hypothetical protein
VNLLVHHQRMLENDSGIATDVIAARSYRSIESKADLRRMGFADSQLLVPTLLVPLWGVGGEIVLYIIAPIILASVTASLRSTSFPRSRIWRWTFTRLPKRRCAIRLSPSSSPKA